MNPIKKLVAYSLAMIVLPIATYFIANTVMQKWSVTSDHWSNIYSAILAVIIVHFVLFSFVYQAYTEEQTHEIAMQKEKKTD